MTIWAWFALFALLLVVVGASYIRVRWHRSPQAYRSMIALAICYFAAGSILGAWTFYLTAPNLRSAPANTASTNIYAAPTAALKQSPLTSLATPVAPFDLGPLHYDPARAVLPDPTLTPGDVFPDATKDDVCTPGWSSDHRHVTESLRDRVYAEYGRVRGPGCCEVDHLIPLELGGSNDIKNLWPQPDDPRPGDAEKDQLENELHRQVCAGNVPLASAQNCIASNWVQCWEKYLLPEVRSASGTASR